tara:strand:+ start:733 stop:969 length:237 start_codon:yes stop_codon:yes gene_type:complete
MPKYQQLFLRNMAAGKAAKSASGAAMSKYDVEVEARLKKLEEAVAKLAANCGGNKEGGGDVEAKLDDLIARLGKHFAL